MLTQNIPNRTWTYVTCGIWSDHIDRLFFRSTLDLTRLEDQNLEELLQHKWWQEKLLLNSTWYWANLDDIASDQFLVPQLGSTTKPTTLSKLAFFHVFDTDLTNILKSTG